MKFFKQTASLAGGLVAALLMSTAIANAAPSGHDGKHAMRPQAERHDSRGAPAKPQFDGRKFARGERHGMKGHCGKAHRHARHERHAGKGRHGHHRMASAGKMRHHGPDRFDRDSYGRDHDRRG